MFRSTFFDFISCHSYHTGSLAFGSLIIAVVQMVRIVLEYLDHKLKGKLVLLRRLIFLLLHNSMVISRGMLMIDIFPGSQNACARYLLCCLKCCFWCLEHFIKFINRNAYIMVSCGAFALPIACTDVFASIC